MTAKCKIITVAELFDDNKYKLNIPDYQRQYKWTKRNVRELINDIKDAIEQSKKNDKLKYRIGTIIMHQRCSQNSEEHEQTEKAKNTCMDTEKGTPCKVYDIVDGQQRIITLALIRYFLSEQWDVFLQDNEQSAQRLCNDAVSRKNIHDNYKCIEQTLSPLMIDKEKSKDSKNNLAEELKAALWGDATSANTSQKLVLEVVIMTVDKLSEAFQLFDSQNSRGKELNPHDLLKAYHLREMHEAGETKYEKENIVKKWEAIPDKDIQDLFNDYLFPILLWSRGESMQKSRKRRSFSAADIDFYKGISAKETYTYAKKTNAARPYFQITEPFISGRDFFEMAHYYIELKKEIEDTIPIKQYLPETIESNDYRIGYVTNLFYCALLRYYDKFHNFEPRAVKNLFVWAFTLRTAMDTVRAASINKYALGETDDKNLSQIPVFSLIANARLHSEISEMTVEVPSEKELSKNWRDLGKRLKYILTGKVATENVQGADTNDGT